MPKYTTKELEALLQFTLPEETYTLPLTLADKTKIFSSLSDVDFSQPIFPLFENFSDTRGSCQFLAKALRVLSCQSLIEEMQLSTLAYELLIKESQSSGQDDAPPLPMLILHVMTQNTELLISRTVSNRHWQCQPQLLDCLAQTIKPNEVLTALSKFYDQDPNTLTTFIKDPYKMQYLSKSSLFLKSWYRLFCVHPDLAMDNTLLQEDTLSDYCHSIAWETLDKTYAQKLLQRNQPDNNLFFEILQKHPIILQKENRTFLDVLLKDAESYRFLTDPRFKLTKENIENISVIASKPTLARFFSNKLFSNTPAITFNTLNPR